MKMKIRYWAAVMLVMLVSAVSAYAQIDRKEVRSGNRDFRKGEWKEAGIDYMKALVKDSTSFAANYNLASVLYRQEEFAQAKEALGKISGYAEASPASADYYFNLGDVAIAEKDWKGAVDAFAHSLLINPGDLEAKENFIYARKMLQNQQNDENNRDDKNNQDDQNDKNGQNDNDDNKDNGQDDKNDQNNGDDNRDKDNNDNDRNGNDNKDGKDNDNRDNGQSQLTPQAAQQMLQAIQAKEKETQDKVQKAKALAAKSRQKEKNW